MFKGRRDFNKYLQEAQKGVPEAQFTLCSMYFLGKGTIRSYDKYEFWLACAYLNNYVSAIETFDKFYDSRYPDLRAHFFNETCPNIIKNYPKYIPYYKS